MVSSVSVRPFVRRRLLVLVQAEGHSQRLRRGALQLSPIDPAGLPGSAPDPARHGRSSY